MTSGIALGLVGLAGLAIGFSSLATRAIENRLTNHYLTAPEELLSVEAQRLAELGGPGIQPLVRGLYGHTPQLRATSAHCLTSLLDKWRSLPVDQSGPQVLLLAKTMAEVARERDTSAIADESWRFSAQLARRILIWPTPPQASYATELVLHCEHVMRSANKAGALSPLEPDATEFAATAAPDLPLPSALSTPIEEPEPKASQAAPVEDASPSVANEEAATDVKPLSPPPEPPQIAEILPPVPETSPAQQDVAGERFSAEAAPPAEFPLSVERARSTPVVSLRSWPSLSDVEVVQRLGDAAEREQAVAELQRRGFTPFLLRLAEATADPDPAVRQRLADMLPELSGIDSRPWLMLLSRDPVPQVRAAAIRWLATSSDPRVQDHLRQLAESETDASVRAALRQGPALAR